MSQPIFSYIRHTTVQRDCQSSYRAAFPSQLPGENRSTPHGLSTRSRLSTYLGVHTKPRRLSMISHTTSTYASPSYILDGFHCSQLGTSEPLWATMTRCRHMFSLRRSSRRLFYNDCSGPLLSFLRIDLALVGPRKVLDLTITSLSSRKKMFLWF